MDTQRLHDQKEVEVMMDTHPTWIEVRRKAMIEIRSSRRYYDLTPEVRLCSDGSYWAEKGWTRDRIRKEAMEKIESMEFCISLLEDWLEKEETSATPSGD